MPSSDYLIELGRYLERVNTHSEQIHDLDERVTQVEKDIRAAKSWIGRAITAGGLWSVGLAINLPAEEMGKIIAKLLRHAP